MVPTKRKDTIKINNAKISANDVINTGLINPIDFKQNSNPDEQDPFLLIFNGLCKEASQFIPPKNPIKRFFYFRKVQKIKKQLDQYKKELSINKDSFKVLELRKKISLMINLVKKKSMLDFKGIKREKLDAKNPGKSIMVNMQLRNGTHTHFLVILEWIYFDFQEGRYLIDDTYKYYDVDSKIYFLDYHQDCCLPIQRNLDINELHKAVREKTKDITTEVRINPKSLKIFMTSDIIQKVMKGGDLEEFFNMIKLRITILIIMVALLILGVIKLLMTKLAVVK